MVLGPGLQNVPVPSFFRETFLVGDFVVQPYRSFIIVLTIGLFILTWWLIFHTSFGMQLRAVSRNRGIASCCGIDDKKINAWTFAYGSALAGAAGVMLAGFKTVSPSMGTPFVIDGFLVVVMGGVGSLFGTLGSAVILGEVQGWVASLLNDVLARAIVFGVIIVVIILRPQGFVLPSGALTMQLLTRNNLQLAAYGLFIVVVMLLPLFMDVFWLNRMSKYLVFGMLGIAISMSWGYAGILNLGQGLFFGFGAYMLAMSLKLASPTSLQQGSADEPVPGLHAVDVGAGRAHRPLLHQPGFVPLDSLQRTVVRRGHGGWSCPRSSPSFWVTRCSAPGLRASMLRS